MGPVGAPTDVELAPNAARGAPDAIAALYHKYSGDLFGVAYRLLHSRADAEDVVHDVFVGLPEALRRYEERGSLRGWLRTVTARVALMRLRDESARDDVPLDAQKLAAPSPAPDTALTVERALARLSPALRAVLVLREIEGFSHAEISAMLGISAGASEVRLHRALRRLRALLSPDDTR